MAVTMLGISWVSSGKGDDWNKVLVSRWADECSYLLMPMMRVMIIIFTIIIISLKVGNPRSFHTPHPLNPHSLPPNVARPILVILFYFILIPAAIGAHKAPTYWLLFNKCVESFWLEMGSLSAILSFCEKAIPNKGKLIGLGLGLA